MMTLNQKIVEILKSHPEGGEKFFNVLDFMLRSDHEIIYQFLRFVMQNYTRLLPYGTFTNDVGFILTGRFGEVIMSNYSRELNSVSKELIIVEGGLRKGAIPMIPREKFGTKNFVVLDDSYYSGNTVRAIRIGMQNTSPHVYVHGALVIYDGSQKKPEEGEKVLSMFRYYE